MNGRVINIITRPLSLGKRVVKGDYPHMNTISTQDFSMAMNSEKWTMRLKHLELTHLEMDTQIKKMEALHEDDLLIRQMKKKKLKLKEQIENIRKDLNI